MTRKTRPVSPFHRLIIAIIGSVLLLFPLATSSQAFADTGNALEIATLTHGYVTGVSDTSAVIFTRLSSSGTVRIIYSTSPTFRRNVRLSGGVPAMEASDYTAHVPLTNLKPNTTYYLKVLVNRKLQQLPFTPRFTTSPLPDALTDFSFAILSDLAVESSLPAPAYQSAASDSPDFVLQIGDFDHRNPGVNPLPITVDNWREMHRDVLRNYASGRDFARYIAPFFPLYHMWDDHDYGADNADRTAPWKDIATQAFKEYYPVPSLPNPEGGLWYSFRFAQAEVFMLDLRSQRDPNDDPPGPDKSMLDGAGIPDGQKDWLKSALLASTARWKFIISTSVWNPCSKQIDSWYLFQNEQAELVQFINDNDITGVIFISGDLHSGGAIDDGTNAFFPEISVPSTNTIKWTNCTGGYCGTWSEGVISGFDPSGYALVTVKYDDVTNTDSAILQAKDAEGNLRLEYVVELP